MAMVDLLVEKLSQDTGSHFEVLRGRVDGKMMYRLKASREDYSHYFQCSRPMKLNDLTRWLASICDMINMGFIPVKRDDT